MQIHQSTDQLLQRRKTPRVALGFDSSQLRPLRGVRLAWEDRTHTEVYDISLTGLVLGRQGVLKDLLNRAKTGALFHVRVEFEAMSQPEDRLSLDLRLVESGENFVTAMVDSISSEGRIKLSQDLKDDFVVQNLVGQSSQRLHPDFQPYHWIHGPFDTNILVRRREAQVDSVIVEYDTLVARWDDGGVKIMKSFPMAEGAEGYCTLWKKAQTQKVSLGASWAERLIKILDQARSRQPDLSAELKSALHFVSALTKVD